jgi:hypothetical protein
MSQTLLTLLSSPQLTVETALRAAKRLILSKNAYLILTQKEMELAINLL